MTKQLLKVRKRYLASIVIFISLCQFPLADMQTCELPNGDEVKTQKIYLWSLLGEVSKIIAWHSNVNHGPPLSIHSWYVPKEWYEFRTSLSHSLEHCHDSSTFDELILISTNGLFAKDEYGVFQPKTTKLDSFPVRALFRFALSKQEENQRLAEINYAGNAVGSSSTLSWMKARNKAGVDFHKRIDAQRRKKYGINTTLGHSGYTLSEEVRHKHHFRT